MTKSKYRVPYRPNWKHMAQCDKYYNGDHCGVCDPCVGAVLYYQDKYIQILLDECRRLGKQR